jgi:hypothetical protein
VQTEPDAFRSSWDAAVEESLRPFLALCFPHIEATVDWSREVVFLDADLEALERDGLTVSPNVDKLIRAFAHDGTQILFHVEIVIQPDSGFAERMSRIYGWLYVRHNLPIALAIVLADADPLFRTNRYEESGLGFSYRLEFPICKLLDFSNEQLARPGDPIAGIIREHLIALRSAQNPA